jgi:AcrR family transcriptional regulator
MTKLTVGRPRTGRTVRGSPENTRESLIATAAHVFNRDGYHGTNSNRIAKEAGYAAGTFYKHFRDKREAFLAVYERWVQSEWNAVQATLAPGGAPANVARTLVGLSVDFHTKWRGFRASLLELVFTDPEVKQFYRLQRRKQLDTIARIRQRIGSPQRSREEDAIYLYTAERVFDGIAHGEIEDLGLKRKIIVEAMVEQVVAMLA